MATFKLDLGRQLAFYNALKLIKEADPNIGLDKAVEAANKIADEQCGNSEPTHEPRQTNLFMLAK